MTTDRSDMVTSITVTRHERGCGYSMDVWYDLGFRWFSDREPVFIKRASHKVIRKAFADFGATRGQVMQACWIGGTLVRDPQTLEVAPTRRLGRAGASGRSGTLTLPAGTGSRAEPPERWGDG